MNVAGLLEPGRIMSELLGPDGAGLLDWLGTDWSSERVNVALPKFEIAVGGSLRQTLGEIGLQGLFAEADLGGISQEPLVVNEAVHRVVLAVDESGAEAAAATGFTVALSAAVPKREPVIFTVDRPFVVLIRHQPSQTLIVAGVINHPLAD